MNVKLTFRLTSTRNIGILLLSIAVLIARVEFSIINFLFYSLSQIKI